MSSGKWVVDAEMEMWIDAERIIAASVEVSHDAGKAYSAAFILAHVDGVSQPIRLDEVEHGGAALTHLYETLEGLNKFRTGFDAEGVQVFEDGEKVFWIVAP